MENLVVEVVPQELKAMPTISVASAPAIEVKDARVCYGRRLVLNGLNMAIEKGTIAGLVGPNGAGKTTLLRLIYGQLQGSVNCVRVDGLDSRAGNRSKQKLFFIESLSMLDLRLSGMDYLRYVKALWQSSVSLEHIIATLGIKSFIKKPLAKLSSGMQQQIMLSLAFASTAPIVLFDEPMNSLDPSNTAIISQQLLKLKQQGATVLLSTHLLPHIDELADIIYYIKDGKVSLVKQDGDARSSSEIYRELFMGEVETIDA